MGDSPALFSGTWASGEPGFGISVEEIPEIQRQLPGVPVTINHKGLEAAVASLERSGDKITSESFRKTLQMSADAGSRAVGTVLSASDSSPSVVFSLNPTFSGLSHLIQNGLLNGISLTHVSNRNGSPTPLELAITNDPARSGAQILHRYKPIRIEQLLTTMNTEETVATPPAPAAEPVVEKTPLETVIEGLSPEQQEIVLARLGEYETKHTELSTAAAEAQKRADDASKALAERSADQEVVKSRIEELKSLLNNNGCASEVQLLENVPSYIDQQSLPHANLALEQVVTACNRALAAGLRPSKRRAVEPAASPAAPTAVASAEATPTRSVLGRESSAVRNLLRTHFD